MPPVTRDVTPDSPGSSGASLPRKPGVPTYIPAVNSAEFSSRMGDGSIYITWDDSNNAVEVCYSVRVYSDVGGGYVALGYVQADGTVGVTEVFQTIANWGSALTISGLTDQVPYKCVVRARNQNQPYDYSDSTLDDCAVMNTVPDVEYGLTSVNLARDITPAKVKVGEITVSGDVAPGITPVGYYGDVELSFLLSSYSGDDADLEAEFSEDSGSSWSLSKATLKGDVTDLPTDDDGVLTEVEWDSYTDSGKSEYKQTCRVRVRAKDESGAWSDWVETDDFTIYNLPGQITWVWSDGQEWGEDTTPTVEAIIVSLNGGDYGFPDITVFASDGTTVIAYYRSIESIIGWEYETSPGTWVAMSPSGIPSAVINGINKMRFTFPVALDTISILLTGRMGEVRDRG